MSAKEQPVALYMPEEWKGPSKPPPSPCVGGLGKNVCRYIGRPYPNSAEAPAEHTVVGFKVDLEAQAQRTPMPKAYPSKTSGAWLRGHEKKEYDIVLFKTIVHMLGQLDEFVLLKPKEPEREEVWVAQWDGICVAVTKNYPVTLHMSEVSKYVALTIDEVHQRGKCEQCAAHSSPLEASQSKMQWETLLRHVLGHLKA